MRTIAEIDADIAKVKAEMQDVRGTGTEVYARIVGYYRSVRNWNRGKREEYNHRKLFVADEPGVTAHLPPENLQAAAFMNQAIPAAAAAAVPAGPVARYELYVRATCPNCPPVKDCCANLPYSGEQIDVDSAEGLARAETWGVFSAPTVIFFDEAGNEAGRAHSVKQIRALPVISGASAVAEPALF